MSVPLAEGILKVAQEGLDLWKTFIATRQEAYSRKADKKQVKAIEASEKAIFETDEIITQLEVAGLDQKPEFKGNVKEFKKYRKRFFKYH